MEVRWVRIGIHQVAPSVPADQDLPTEAVVLLEQRYLVTTVSRRDRCHQTSSTAANNPAAAPPTVTVGGDGPTSSTLSVS